jgi:uncharacterized membrane-anchored protein
MRLIKNFFGWLNRNLSADPSTSNSRTLQTLIVINLVVMCWLVLATANWTISDNLRLVLICLITGGAGGYIANKISSGGAS